MSEIVSMTEAVGITGLPEDQIEWLLKGSRPALEPLSLKHCLGAKLVADLIGAVNLESAVSIAATAARNAEVGRDRLLVVAWANGNPRCCWHAGGVAFEPGVRNPFLAIPADQSLADLTDRLAAHRAAASQPN